MDEKRALKYKSKHDVNKEHPPMDLSDIMIARAEVKRVATTKTHSATSTKDINPKILGELMDAAIKRKKEESELPAIHAERLSESEKREQARHKQKVREILNHPQLPPPPLSESKFVSQEDLEIESGHVWDFINRVGSNVELNY